MKYFGKNKWEFKNDKIFTFPFNRRNRNDASLQNIKAMEAN